MVGIEPPSRMKIGRTPVVLAVAAAAGVVFSSELKSVSRDVGSGLVGTAGVAAAFSGSAAVFPSGDEELELEDVVATAAVVDGRPVLLVSVDDVGTVVPRAERLRAESLRVEEVEVDMMIRSACDARLSDESLRGTPPALGLLDVFAAADSTRGLGGGG